MERKPDRGPNGKHKGRDGRKTERKGMKTKGGRNTNFKYKKMETSRKHKEQKQKGDTYSEYNSKSCSPESPIRKNLESGNESIISCTPARLRVAGADNRPLKMERPAYDLSFIEPSTKKHEYTFSQRAYQRERTYPAVVPIFA